MYEIGDTYLGTYANKDAAGTLVNAGVVTVTITLPDGTTASPAVANPSTGNYTFTYPITQSGQHPFVLVGTGANAFAQTDVFNSMLPTPIISLAEARRGIGVGAANTTSDEDLRSFIVGAGPIMEDIIGSISPKTRVETFDGGSVNIPLMYPPLMSVTTVIESMGSGYQKTLTLQNPFNGSVTDSYGYSIDLATGILTRRASGVAVPFMPGIRNIQVTYLSGRILSGNELLACRRLVKHLWQSEQQNYSPQATSPEAMGMSPSGYAVPRVVLELCAASTRLPGMA